LGDKSGDQWTPIEPGCSLLRCAGSTKYWTAYRKTRKIALIWGEKMNMIDWDWQAQLETCQRRIIELEEKIVSQRRKLQRLLDGNMNAIFAERILAMREESLERVRSWKRLIETRIADRAADRLVEPPCLGDQRAKWPMPVANSRLNS
jgi:hypothetical protein